MANQVIFSGAPSQACNLPALLKGSAVMAMICAIHACASNSFPLQWHVLLAQAGAVLIGVGLPFVKTAFTRIVVDTARITSIHPWWQRLFGTGSIILMTNDLAHPVRRLPGIRDVDELRKRLAEAVIICQERTIPANTYDPNTLGYSKAHGV
jgi:hypothetical protein